MHDHQKSTWLANVSVIAVMEFPKCMHRKMHVCTCGWMDICIFAVSLCSDRKILLLITFLVFLAIISKRQSLEAIIIALITAFAHSSSSNRKMRSSALAGATGASNRDARVTGRWVRAHNRTVAVRAAAGGKAIQGGGGRTCAGRANRTAVEWRIPIGIRHSSRRHMNASIRIQVMRSREIGRRNLLLHTGTFNHGAAW